MYMNFVLIGILTYLSWEDIRDNMISLWIPQVGIIIGLVWNCFIEPSYTFVFGASAGFFLFWAAHKLYKYLRKKEGLGLGDAWVVACIGAFNGIHSLYYIVLFACVFSLFHFGAFQVFIKLNKLDLNNMVYIPFVPFLFWGSCLWLTIQSAL